MTFDCTGRHLTTVATYLLVLYFSIREGEHLLLYKGMAEFRESARLRWKYFLEADRAPTDYEGGSMDGPIDFRGFRRPTLNLPAEPKKKNMA